MVGQSVGKVRLDPRGVLGDRLEAVRDLGDGAWPSTAGAGALRARLVAEPPPTVGTLRLGDAVASDGRTPAPLVARVARPVVRRVARPVLRLGARLLP